MKETEKKQIRAVIVEDEEANRVVLRGLLELYCPQVEVVAEAPNVEMAFAAICRHRPDLALLDIRLEDSTVFDLLSRFEILDFQIIILTAYPEFDYAQQGIRYGVRDYLLKPYRIEDLQKAVEKVAAALPSKSRQSPKLLFLPSSAGQSVVQTEQITHLVADGPYTHVFLSSKEKFLVSKNLKQFEELLFFPPFFRCHDSAIINFGHVVSFLRDGQVGRVELAGGKSAPISARRLSEFLERFREFAEQ